jgi:hypothetical protein
LILALFALLIATGLASAAPEVLKEFHDFRYVSCLPGNGFGVTPEGRAGFDGALQMNIPVAYTPCWGNWIAGAWSGSTEKWRVHLGSSGPNIDGMAMVAAGFGPSGHGFYFANVFTSRQGDICYNAQYQITRDNWDKPAFAVGVLDLSDRRDESTSVHRGARSFYGVATGRLGTEKKFLYITLGYGNGKFNSRPFGGISWPVSPNVTLYTEYDGFQINSGVALSPHDRLDDARWNAVLLAGLAHMNRPDIGLALTYNP